MASSSIHVTILVPAFEEEIALPATLAAIAKLDPPPDEVLLVDGGSSDATVALARSAGLCVLRCPRKGRAVQINLGVEQAAGEVVCVLHADSILPTDAIRVIREAMTDQRTVLASFMPRFVGTRGTRWGSTLHNWAKTWYAPLLLNPRLFARGVRLLFGDHAMFFRRAQFLQVGGCDERVAVMEDADLCIRLAPLGRTRMVLRWTITSDRRIAQWGRWRANWIYFKVAVLWAMGAREKLADHYPDVR